MFSWRFLIFLVCVTSVYGYKDLEYELGHASSRADVCIQQGTQCSEDCTSVLFCSGPGQTPIVTRNCSADGNLFCFSNNSPVATCSTESDCAGGRVPFVCKEPGNFPDPFDCRSSYTCEANNPSATERCSCPSGTVWEGNDNECNNNTENLNGCCQEFEANCDDNNIGGAFGASCSLTTSGYYYICERAGGNTSISVHKCPDGLIFVDTSYTCTSARFSKFYEHGKGIFSTYKKIEKVRPNCQAIPGGGGDGGDGDEPTCTFDGQTFPVPNTCRGYWVCDINLRPIRRDCQDGTILDCSNGGQCNCVVCLGCCTGP